MIALGCLVGLAAAEGAIRLANAVNPGAPETLRRSPWSSGPQIQRWPRARTGGPRLLVVGDADTFGHGVAGGEAFPAHLARALASRQAQIVSYSRPGWNTRREWHALEKDFDEQAPDLLILAHCLNDAEPYPSDRMLVERPDLLPWEPRGALERRLAATSALFVRLRLAVDRIRLRRALRSHYHGLYSDPANVAIWRRSLKRIERLAAQRSVPAVLVVFPIFESDLDSDYAYGALHEEVVATARGLGYRVLDLLPAYAGHVGRELALVPYSDPHPSALAHEIAGREIARFLESEGLLEPRPPNAPRRRAARKAHAPR